MDPNGMPPELPPAVEPIEPFHAPPPSQKQFPCHQCGAKMVFDPAVQSITCPYCGHNNPIPQSEKDIKELDYRSYLGELAEKEPKVEPKVMKCKSCAAETTVDSHVTASECPFCGSALVDEPRDEVRIQPKSLLPFLIPRDRAFQAFREWLKGLWFAPSGLKKYARAENTKLQGIYIPYWTFDSNTTTFYRGERGDDYWTTEWYTARVNGRNVRKTRRVKKTRWHNVSGVVYNGFDDILILASFSLPYHFAEKLEPWDLYQLVPFNPDYLAGYRAEAYQLELPDGFDQAKVKMEPAIRRTIRKDIGGDHQRIHTTSSQYDNITFKHILLPIWISSYRFRDKVYRFLVNGRTGEVQGERPLSWLKIILLILLVVVIAAAIGFGIMMAQGR